MRKPSEMTLAEEQHASDLLPAPFSYKGCRLETYENGYACVYLDELKPFFDYLTSINVDPYATT